MSRSFHPRRRELLTGGLAAAGIGLAATATTTATAAVTANAPQARSFDGRRPADSLYGLVKLMGSLDPDELTYLWGIGQVAAVTGGESAVPLFDVHICRLSYYRPLPDDVYEHRYWSCLFFVDSRSGTLLQQWTNPLTGASVRPGHYRGGPLTVLHRPDGLREPGKLDRNPLKADGLDPFVLPWVVNGDDVWCTFDSNFDLENYDTYVLKSSWRALTDPALRNAPASYAYYGGSRYYRWLGMGDRPGYLRWRVSGAKTSRRDALPATIGRWADERFPGLLDRPQTFTERAVIYRPEGTEPTTP